MQASSPSVLNNILALLFFRPHFLEMESALPRGLHSNGVGNQQRTVVRCRINQMEDSRAAEVANLVISSQSSI